MAAIPESDTFFAADRAAWREWLAAHHGSATRRLAPPPQEARRRAERDLRRGRRGSPVLGLDRRPHQPLGRAQLRGALHAAQAGSVWSESNVARVERMIAEGLMTPAGQALVDEAKRRGTWDEAASGRLEVTPPDLEEALAADPAAAGALARVGAEPPPPVHLLGPRRQAARNAGPARRRGRAPRFVGPQAGGEGLAGPGAQSPRWSFTAATSSGSTSPHGPLEEDRGARGQSVALRVHVDDHGSRLVRKSRHQGGRVHDPRGPDHEHDVAILAEGLCAVDGVRRQRLAEPHDVRPQVLRRTRGSAGASPSAPRSP